MKLRDNQALCDEVRKRLAHVVPMNALSVQVCANNILDAVDRHLTQGGPLDDATDSLNATVECERIAANDRIYPCADCGMMRTKDEGGTIFTVCEACWDKHYHPGRARADSRPPPVSGWRCDSCRDAGCELCRCHECRHLLIDHNCPKGECGCPGCPCQGGTGRSNSPTAKAKCWSQTGHCVNHGACNMNDGCMYEPKKLRGGTPSRGTT